MIAVLAHAGHVLVDIGTFGTPVIMLSAAMIWSTRRERKRRAESPGGPASA